MPTLVAQALPSGHGGYPRRQRALLQSEGSCGLPVHSAVAKASWIFLKILDNQAVLRSGVLTLLHTVCDIRMSPWLFSSKARQNQKEHHRNQTRDDWQDS